MEAKQEKNTRKRKYSRGGCDECKRRKMKCDEGNPFCYNCTRLGKVCVYLLKHKFVYGSSEFTKGETLKSFNANEKSLTDNITRNGEIPIRHYQPKVKDGHKLGSYLNGTYTHEMGHINDNNLAFGNHIVHPPLSLPSYFTPPLPNQLGQGPHQLQQLITEISNQQNRFHDGSSFGQPTMHIHDTGATGEFLNNYSPRLNDDCNMNVQELFDEASLLVNDINTFVSVDMPLPNDSDMSLDNPENIHSIHSILPIIEGANYDVLKDLNSPGNLHISAVNETDKNYNKPYTSSPDEPFETGLNGEEDPMVINSSEPILNSKLIEQIIKDNKLTTPHAEYLKTLGASDLSYHLFPFASSIESNQVVHLLLKYLKNAPYLLTSILATSATFLYNKTGKEIHDSARQKYITVCLSSLNEVYSQKDAKKSSVIMSQGIERLLLTVLLLTSALNATTHKDIFVDWWKVHLAGAKELLVNYTTATEHQNKHGKPYLSPGLAMAKVWFFAMESIANLMLPFGGTLAQDNNKKHALGYLTTDSEDSDNKRIFIDTAYFNREKNPEYHEMLVKLGLLISNHNAELADFNLYLGFTIELVDVIHEFTRALDHLRLGRDLQLSADEIAKIMSLLLKAREAQVVPGYDRKSYIVPKTSPAHPDYPSSPEKVILPPAAYHQLPKENESQYYTWFDVSHQSHVDLFYLKMYITPGFIKLPKSHNIIRGLVERLMGHFLLIKPKTSPDYEQEKSDIVAESENFYFPGHFLDNRLIMVHAAFRMILKLIDRKPDFEKLEVYFKTLIKLGNGSATKSLRILEKYRDRKFKLQNLAESTNTNVSCEQTQNGRDEDSDDLTDEMETIPFT